MFNVCWRCGSYHADKTIVPAVPAAICPECGHAHPFLRLPLLIVSGASGAGKSAVCQYLLGRVAQAVLLDSDILWRPEFNTPDDNYRDFFETWLRVCKNISQSGRPVALFGAGAGVPDNLEPCIERRYFSQLHYLALVCADDTLTARLQHRPAWRGAYEPAYVEEHLRFNQWFRAYSGQPTITLLDTTRASVPETAQQVAAWIAEKIRGAG